MSGASGTFTPSSEVAHILEKNFTDPGDYIVLL